MRKVFLILTILVFSFSACKTSKHATKSAYEPAIEKTVIKELPAPSVVKEKVKAPETEAPIVMKTEQVTIEKSNDQKLYAFYVIIGSFSMTENAHKLQDQQMAKGMPAVVLKSETGMLRVASLGTDSESDARSKIGQIRNQFPDAWLLKTK